MAETKDMYQNLENNTINIYIAKLNNLKCIVPRNYFKIIPIAKYGNCYFRRVSQFLSGNENNPLYIRNVLYKYILANKEYCINNNGIIQNNTEITYIDEYIDNIKNDGNFSRELEKIATTEIFEISIYVFEFTDKYSGFRFIYKKECSNEIIPYCMILNHVYLNGKAEHYELLEINRSTFQIDKLNDENNNYIILEKENSKDKNNTNERKLKVKIAHLALI